jgi:hypothetical protein
MSYNPKRVSDTFLLSEAGARSRNPERSRGSSNGKILNEKLVEAAGVEPASENVTGQETTCLFRFMPQAFGALRRFPQDVRGCALRTDKKR